MKKIIRIIASITAATVLGTMGLVSYYSYSLPQNYRVFSWDSLSSGRFMVSTKMSAHDLPTNASAGKEIEVNYSLFGIIPIKKAHISRLSEQSIIPCGTPFGVKILADGVLVIGLSTIPINNGEKNPAKDAGIKVGDVVLSIDGRQVLTNSEVAEIVSKSKGRKLKVIYRRKGEERSTMLEPAITTSSQEYKAGMWVRDSSAGIGTVTFCTGEGAFGGLGHPICDVDTGEIMPLGSGEIVGASISGVKKGNSGSPGELCGEFINNDVLGAVKNNCESGLYGILDKPLTVHEPVSLGLKQEVKLGDATIFTTISGQQPQEYKIRIESVDLKSDKRNLVIKVVDERLLSNTGGVVQGMSGSPIIQNGKLVGAVTHVLVNDPTKGYGIFAETMMDRINEMK